MREWAILTRLTKRLVITHKITRIFKEPKKKEMILCYPQACQNTEKPTKLTKISKIHVIRMIKINLYCKKMIIPSYLNDIQPRSTQVWNCDEVGFDPNGIWSKVICTYKFFKVNECGKCKLENEHHYGAHYLSLPKMIGNASCHP